jgi:hypothetical protein
MRNFLWSLLIKYKNWSYDRKVMKYFGCKPEKIYLSQEDYDKLAEKLNAPPDPEVQERLRKLLDREAPWDKQ